MRRRLFLIAGLLTLMIPAATQAANGGLGLTPAMTELTLEQGQETAEFTLNLSNTTDKPIQLKLSTLDFGALDDAGGVEFIGRTGQGASDFGLKQWMSLETEALELLPNESRGVKVIVKNEESLRPGGHYGAVVVSYVEDSIEPDSVAVLPAASTLVLLKKNGGEKYEIKIESKKTNNSLINLPKNVELKFHNTGNIHAVPRGTVELKGPFGATVSRGVINENSSFVLPDAHRIIKVPLTGYKQPWLPGHYKLAISWRYDGKSTFETVEYSYWYAGKLIIILVIILSLIIVLKLYKNYKSWDK